MISEQSKVLYRITYEGLNLALVHLNLFHLTIFQDHLVLIGSLDIFQGIPEHLLMTKLAQHLPR